MENWRIREVDQQESLSKNPNHYTMYVMPMQHAHAWVQSVKKCSRCLQQRARRDSLLPTKRGLRFWL